MDFDRVIARWPKAESAAAAWQRAAQIYAGRQDMANMAKYYEGLIQNFPKASPAALAEAHFLLGRAAFDQGDFKSSISPRNTENRLMCFPSCPITSSRT